MSSTLLAFVMWIAWAMLTWCPTTNMDRIVGYGFVARSIARATSSADDAALLASIGSLESGYAPHAVGKKGELGVWQLMPPVACPELERRGGNLARVLDCQARVALSRIHEQGMCGYTGEAADPSSDCPMARTRMNRANVWVYRNPPPAAASASPPSEGLTASR